MRIEQRATRLPSHYVWKGSSAGGYTANPVAVWHPSVCRLFFTIGALFVGHTTVALAQSVWCEYQLRSISGLVDEQRAAAAGTKAMFSADQMPFRAIVRYTGRQRPITADRQRFLAEYLVGFLGRTDAAGSFTRELLFQEESTQYWLPIQESMVGQFDGEVLAGDTLTVFLLFAGVLSERVEGDPVLLIAEFTSPATASYWHGELRTCTP